MEDQGKRLILAVAAAIGILFLWQALFPSKKKPEPTAGSGSAITQPASQNPIGQAATTPAPGSGAASGSGAAPGSGAASGSSAAPGSGSAAVAENPANPIGQTTAAKSTSARKRDAADELAIDLGDVHAVFTKWGGDLVSWQITDPRYLTTPEKGEVVLAAAVGGAAFDVNFAQSDFVLPPDAIWQGKHDAGSNVVTYTYADDKFTITKTYTLRPSDSLVKLEIGVEAKAPPAGQPAPTYHEQLALSVWGYQNKEGEKVGRTKREWSAACMSNGSVQEDPVFKLKEVKNGEGVATWAGIDHPYYLLAMAPKPTDSPVQCMAFPSATTPGLVQMALLFTPSPIKAGDPAFRTEVWAYVGPKYMDRLEAADDIAGFKTGFSKSVGLGWFSFIARPMLSLLQLFYGFAGNWGLSIILLTVLVKLVTLYWTTKSMRSMKAMAALKPRIDELTKKYANDRARQQQEMMALYKQHGVNPLAGCLPILLQMPIWMALYKMLSTATELYNTPFIPGWINDLTAQDPYYILGVALVILMFVQAKLQPATADGFQQKLMMYGLPGIFGVMSLFFPSGLTLYILTNTILTAIHSLYMRKWDRSATMFAAAPGGKPVRDVPRATVVRKDEVIDAASEEQSDDAGDDDDGGDEGGAVMGAKPSRGSQPQKQANRPRRGQRRRGRN